MNKPLAGNAREAWGTALDYYEKLIDGYITFRHKKQFVFALQNTAELILKQIMIDQKRREVLVIDRDDSKWDQDTKDFMESDDLNDFLSAHLAATNDRLFAKSIGFREMLDYVKVGKCFSKPILSAVTINTFKAHLTDLNKLRNSAWHFRVDEFNFLTALEFKQLSMLVDELFQLICSKDYDPLNLLDSTFGYENDLSQLLEEKEKPVSRPKAFQATPDYKTLIKDSETNNAIARYAHQRKISIRDGEEDLWDVIIDSCASKFSMSLEELEVRFSLMFHHGFIALAPPVLIDSDTYDECADDGTIIPIETRVYQYWYNFSIR